jgi:hypothetical protein
MTIESYLNFALSPAEPEAQPDLARPSEDALESLIHNKSRILGRKLDILAAQIWWRLRIACHNLARIQNDKSLLSGMLIKLDQAARYHLRDHQEKGMLYRKLFELDSESRTEEVECWRDVATVMRDFLTAWEAHEQTRARAIFLENVGPGTQGYL